MKPVLVCLHGWGGTKESFTELRAALEGSSIEILTPDLPGFGSEPEPAQPWSTNDYADWVADWIHRNVRRDASLHLLGHSHGGRITLKLAHRQSLSPIPNSESRIPRITHLYLCAAAGIRHPRHIRRIIGLFLAKSGKLFFGIPGLRLLAPLGKTFLYKLVRVHDYEQASPVMRQILINVSKEDLRPLLKDIRIPTDIFWGDDDRMTPVADGVLMERMIPGSVLHRYPGVRHRVHRDKAREIAEIIRKRVP